MKYYLDFEASQYNEKIISIGCISESGRTFYSLVHPTSKKVMTNFIAQLTGLTWDLLQTAPTLDEVFINFNTWLQEDLDDIKTFYVYGNEDRVFINNSIASMQSETAIWCATYLLNHLVNYVLTIKDKFQSELALVTLLAYYRKQPITSQKHNALEDAQWLMEVVSNVENDEQSYSASFAANLKKLYPKPKLDVNYQTPVLESRYHRTNGRVTRTFLSEEQAVEFLYNVMKSRGIKNAKKDNIKKRLYNAITKKQMYCDYYWNWNQLKEG